MKNILNYIMIGAVLLTILSSSCSKKETLGPSIQGLYGPLELVETLKASNSNPNFDKKDSSVHFTAKFSSVTAWTLTITGQTSKATKTITGVSKFLDATNATWEGYADMLPSFKAEKIAAVLTFKNSPDVLVDSLTLGGKKNIFNQGVLVSNFASGSKIGNVWAKDFPLITVANNAYPQIEGSYLYMEGTPWSGTPKTPYVNYFNIPVSTTDNPGAYSTVKSNKADNVYFNIFIYGTETPETWLAIQLKEDGTNTRALNIRPDWVGWKLISVKYSDFTNGDNTVGLPDPSKLTAIQFVLLSDAVPAESVLVKTAYDFPVFTIGKPFQP